MAIFYDTNRYRTKTGKKYYLSIDNTLNNETYSVHSFTQNSDFTNKTGTLMYSEKLRGLKKGATDDLINDNADLIDSYGSLDFINTVRNQIIKGITK
tara:strand:- start:1459 stop:1749 length:291 start_codon:yes stop_codon:yes gene_type:complete